MPLLYDIPLLKLLVDELDIPEAGNAVEEVA